MISIIWYVGDNAVHIEQIFMGNVKYIQRCYIVKLVESGYNKSKLHTFVKAW